MEILGYPIQIKINKQVKIVGVKNSSTPELTYEDYVRAGKIFKHFKIFIRIH